MRSRPIATASRSAIRALSPSRTTSWARSPRSRAAFAMRRASPLASHAPSSIDAGREAALAVSRLFCRLDPLQASSLCVVLRGETCRLSPQAPLSLWCGSRPARPFGPLNGRCRDFPKQDGEGITLCCALMLRAFPASDPSLLWCARRLIVRAPSMSVPLRSQTSRRLTTTARFSISHQTGLAAALFLRRGSQACACDRCCFV